MPLRCRWMFLPHSNSFCGGVTSSWPCLRSFSPSDPHILVLTPALVCTRCAKNQCFTLRCSPLPRCSLHCPPTSTSQEQRQRREIVTCPVDSCRAAMLAPLFSSAVTIQYVTCRCAAVFDFFLMRICVSCFSFFPLIDLCVRLLVVFATLQPS